LDAKLSHNTDVPKSVELRLLMNPIRIESNNAESERVSRVTFERTTLEGEAGKQKCIGTGELESIPADLVIVSVGYKGIPLKQMNIELLDSARGVVANDCGKVRGENNIFVSGWIKRGPIGIIGTNITDAKETAASIMKYVDSETHQQLSNSSINESPKGREGLMKHLDLQGVKAVAWDQFLQIDEAERDRDRLRNDSQPREKILSIDEMLSFLRCK
jgi:NADPH-dependent glutamate synthase beta subunit-like oxidoreductase